jgi:hypothetical protein
MLVASSRQFWDEDRQRFKIHRPPSDHIESICIDSGGFTAAKRWGRYPWTPAQYADWIAEESRDVQLDFCATMDYACEKTVNRSILTTNKERIEESIQNELACRQVAPDLPWLPVLQGDNLAEREFDLSLRRRLGLIPATFAGLGSICGRGVVGARQVIKFYRHQLPGVKYHAFGLHVQALDDDEVFMAVRSWDSYSWNWGKGQKGVDRPTEYLQKTNESYSQFTRRMGELYWQNTVLPRLTKPRHVAVLL